MHDLESLQAAARAGERLDYLFFWKPAPPDEPVGPGCLGQWYARPFTVDGVEYATAEHFMMAGKAELFHDRDTFSRILADPDPREAKRLGRRVKPFDEQRWRAHRVEIVVRGNLHKFAAGALRDYLLSTGDRVLVEASPLDRIWGIGLGAEHLRARDPLAWRGLNLLGFALMEVRALLRREAQA